MTHEEIKVKLLSAKIKKHYYSLNNFLNEKYYDNVMYEDNTFHIYTCRKKDLSKFHEEYNGLHVSCYSDWELISKVLFGKKEYQDAYGSIKINDVLFLNDYDKANYSEINLELVTITSIDRKGNVRSTTTSFSTKYNKIICIIIFLI